MSKREFDCRICEAKPNESHDVDKHIDYQMEQEVIIKERFEDLDAIIKNLQNADQDLGSYMDRFAEAIDRPDIMLEKIDEE